MTVYEAVFLAVLQTAMAEFGEWLRLLEAAPNHHERLAVSVHSARNCSLSKQEQQQDTVDSINVGGKETGQGWESWSLVVFEFCQQQQGQKEQAFIWAGDLDYGFGPVERNEQICTPEVESATF